MQNKTMMFLLFALLGSNSYAADSGANSVVSDKKNAIYWQDNLFTQKSSEDWEDAAAYCDVLVLNGLSNWRLPSFEELHSIVDYTRFDPAINPVFAYVHHNTYWTSKDFSATKSRAWTINFKSGKTYYSYKTTNHSVRCVADFSPTAKDKK